MIRSARWIELIAPPGRERDVRAFLVDALPVAQRDEAVKCWLGVRLDRSTFAIFYATDSEDEDEEHFSAALTEVLKDRAGSLFSQEPKVRTADVLAVKLPFGD